MSRQNESKGSAMAEDATGATDSAGDQEYRSGTNEAPSPEEILRLHASFALRRACCNASDPLTDARCLLYAGHKGECWGHGPIRRWNREEASPRARPPAVSKDAEEWIHDLAEDINTDLRVNGYETPGASWFDIIIRQNLILLEKVSAEAFALGVAHQRSVDAPYLRHKDTCEFLTHRQGSPDFGGELRFLRPADCTCGLAALVDQTGETK